MNNETNMKASVGLAVVGMGYWGKNLVRNFSELGALVAVCDSNPEVREALAREYPATRYVPEYGELLSDPAISAVALASPAVTHYDMARAALEAGKDVYVEKPLAIDLKEGRNLVELAERRRRILMVGHILRYHPAIVKLHEMIRAGALGKIQCLYSNRLNIGKIRTEENILWSFAPHDISVILSLLDESPSRVACQGGAYLNRDVFDVTLSQFEFPNGVLAHIFVSWLHPFKEQRLVVVGSEKMAVFDDTSANKLVLYPHKVEWKNRVPMAIKAQGEPVALNGQEPLRIECRHFLDCATSRSTPLTDGREGLKVLEVLDACQRSLLQRGAVIELEATARQPRELPYFAHESAFVDAGADVGAGTKVWHFSHIIKGARIGEKCVIGQNVNVDGGAVKGINVKIQHNVSVYTGAGHETATFLGPSYVLTNVSNPRAQINRHSLYEQTILKRGCTIGANATIVCGVTIGRYAFVAAGSVVTKSVPDYGLVMGNPAKHSGWMSRHGHRLNSPDSNGVMRCPEHGHRYEEIKPGVLRCLDLDEEAALPVELTKGAKSYKSLKPALAQSLTAGGTSSPSSIR